MVYTPFFLIICVSLSLFQGEAFHNVSSTTTTAPRHRSHRQLENKALSIEQIDDAITKAKSFLSLVYSRYEYDTPRGKLFLTMQSNMKEKDFELLKLIYQKKLTAENPMYKMVFGGSSVTAGHDSLFQQSHPKILENRMRPIFEALGVVFEVDNIAQGANDCLPSNMCYDAMAGEGGDFYMWEQSFNCGRDFRNVELIVRMAARNEASVYIMSSGGVDTKKCPPSKESKPTRTDEMWKPAEPITISDAQVLQFKEDLIAVNKLGQSMGKSALPLAKHYSEGPASSGMNVWFAYPSSLCSDVKPAPKTCDVPTIIDECSLKFLTKEASEYGTGGGASHHPSR
jgi:hypothetical protein